MIVTVKQVWGRTGAINYSKENKDLSDSFEQTVKIRFSVHVGLFGCDGAGLVCVWGFSVVFCGGLLFIFLNMNIMAPPKLSPFSKCY